jgi:hypothetical protein
MGVIHADLTFLPQPKYTSPRSYWKGFLLVSSGDLTWTGSSGDYTFREHTYGGYGLRIHFKPTWWRWSSNSWSIDYLFEDFYGLAPGSTMPDYAGAYSVGTGIGLGRASPWLAVVTPGTSTNYEFILPTAPAGYWLPPFPP